MDYPATLTKDDNNTILVTFPDIEGVTYGETVEDALDRASDALATMLEAYVKDRRPIPAPSTGPSKYWVRVPALVEAKVRLYEAMRAGKVNKSELARRMSTHPPQVDRLLEMKHGSQLEQIEAAFSALGKRLVISVVDFGPPIHAGKLAISSRTTRKPARAKHRSTTRRAHGRTAR